jgi:hypothetical protein
MTAPWAMSGSSTPAVTRRVSRTVARGSDLAVPGVVDACRARAIWHRYPGAGGAGGDDLLMATPRLGLVLGLG